MEKTIKNLDNFLKAKIKDYKFFTNLFKYSVSFFSKIYENDFTKSLETY